MGEHKKQQFPSQHQHKQPGQEHKMKPRPAYEPFYPGSGRFKDQVVLISGGDSGIGRAVALAFANEGAKVAIIYLPQENRDAHETQAHIEQLGSEAMLIVGDVSQRDFCQQAIKQVVKEWKRIDVLVNNAAEQHLQSHLEEISELQLRKTFESNIFAYFFLAQSAMSALKEHKGCIINTTSVTAYRGSPGLIDYSATKGAIVSFTRSLAKNLVEHGIRVNAVAPGPIWTPLIPASFCAEDVKTFGADTPMKRAGQPNEVAGAFTFLASLEAQYITGQVIHVNGGEIVNG